jgi:hypothetical protein
MRLELPWVQSTHGSATNNYCQPGDCPQPAVSSLGMRLITTDQRLARAAAPIAEALS